MIALTVSCAAAAVLVLCAAGSPAAADDVAACQNGKGDDAIAACTRLLKRRNAVVPQVVYRVRGDAYLDKSDYDRAIADYSEALKLKPDDVMARNNRGIAYQRKGDNDRAIADYSEAIQLDPKDLDIRMNRGLAYQAKGDYDRAIADYDEALKRDPNRADVRNNRDAAMTAKVKPDVDTCSKEGGDADAAVAACTRLLDVPWAGVNRGAVYRIRGNAYVRRSDFDRAMADYGESLKLAPQDANTYYSRGVAYARKGDSDRAFADYDEAIRLDPKQAYAYNGRGWAFYLKGDFDRAIADADEAVRLAPGVASFWDTRGAAYIGKGDHDRAIADLDRAIRLDPTLTAAHGHLGLAYSGKGDFDRAMAEANQAIAVDPKDGSGYATRAAIYAFHGDRDLAMADYQTAAKLNPSLVGTAELRKVLAALAAPPAARPQEAAASPRVQPPVQAAAEAPQRVALVIGNAAYRAVAPLSNPRRDAEAVAAALRQTGFQTVDLALDLDREGMVKALRAFREKADRADWALLYFAGHGIEIDRVNYLIPIDARLADDRDVREEAVSYETLMNAIGGARALRLVVLDACRNNPFRDRMRRSVASRGSGDRGLAAPPESEPGTLVVYSAKEGAVAEDDVDGANSPFARAFVAELQVPGLEVRRVFDNVRDDVIEATHRRQQPFTYGSLPGRRDFFFNPAK